MSDRLKHITIFCILMFIQQTVFGVEGKPKMRRACLNKSDSTVTLLWYPPTDNCATFTLFNLYGQEDALSVYMHMGQYNNFSLNAIQFKIPNLKDWKFYLVYSLACNGTDSIYSDTIQIDNSEPVISEIDSVSVDFATQTTMIGWKQNPSPDIRGYILYYNFGTNSIIGNTSNTFISDLNPARSPTTRSYSYGIAAYDSCINTSPISAIHSTIYLSTVYSQCTKTIDLNWTSYGGWTAQSYDVHLSINSGPYQKIATVGNINTYSYIFPNFGDQYCFYVRALKVGAERITSSSNIACASSNSIIPASDSYIAKVSVENQTVEMTLVTQFGTSLQEVNIYKSEDNGAFLPWQTIKTTGGTLDLVDNQVNVHSHNYSYYFTTEGPCDLIFDTSQTCKTILLNVQMLAPGNNVLDWNGYFQFKKATEKQELLLSDNPNANKSSPWNILNTLGSGATSTTDNSEFSTVQEQLCYCIRAIENSPNQFYRRQDTSYSNIECLTADPIVYFPNAIQLNGFNTVFYPQGVFLDYNNCSFQIFDRWGAFIFETHDIRKGWDGTTISGNLVEQGVYAYKSRIVGINGKELFFDGTITVLK